MYPQDLFLGISLYEIMIALGIIVALLTARAAMSKASFSKNEIRFFLIAAYASIIIGFLGAILFQSIYTYISTKIFAYSGMTFLGGLIVGSITFFIIFFLFGKNVKKRIFDFINIAPISICFAHAIGRIGCFFSGCCYGKLTNSNYGVIYDKSTYAYYIFGEGRTHPVQLYEFFFLIALGLVLLLLLFKKKEKYNLAIYLTHYGVFRFLIEFIRADDRGGLSFLSPSQFQSIILFIVGTIIIIYNKKRRVENAF